MTRKDVRFNAKYIKNGANKRKDNKVQGEEIGNGTITGKHIADGSITADKFAPGAVSTAGIQDGSVTTAKLVDGSVTTAKLVDNNVTSSKIANGAITDSKFSSDVQQRLDNGFIKKQIVNRRPVVTEATPAYSSHAISIYGPFSYNVPAVQSGAQRRFRIYAVYSDNVQSAGLPGDGRSILVSFDMVSNDNYHGWYGYNAGQGPYMGDYNFYLPYTYGDSNTYRDAFSNEITGNLNTSHATMWFGPYNDATGRTLRVLYMEIQTLDVFP